MSFRGNRGTGRGGHRGSFRDNYGFNGREQYDNRGRANHRQDDQYYGPSTSRGPEPQRRQDVDRKISLKS